ncbi:MAG TPA: lysylphosphatidylglycerol synthase transmembrane domain-containing protein, partial [Planctomycetota bacterium]|nr:lysylphosphatidylglycerol synthase transmembrane domain-containing protein [Planctomycetota bacterium]
AMLAISAAHNLAAYVLPAKTGEMALVVYLRSHSGVPATAGLAALRVSRLLDLATLCLCLSAAMVYLAFARPAVVPAWFHAVALLLLAATALLLLLSARSDVLVRSAAWLARSAGLARWKLAAKLLLRAEELGLALREAPAGRALWIAAAQSLAMWLGIFVFYCILARSFGLPADLGLADAAFGSSLAVLTNLLPVNSFAGFGTQEGGWVVGFGVLGVPRDLALSTGLGVHLAQLASTIVLGLAGHAAMGWLPGRAAASEAAADAPGKRVG